MDPAAHYASVDRGGCGFAIVDRGCGFTIVDGECARNRSWTSRIQWEYATASESR